MKKHSPNYPQNRLTLNVINIIILIRGRENKNESKKQNQRANYRQIEMIVISVIMRKKMQIKEFGSMQVPS
jgi:hypothetical protein